MDRIAFAAATLSLTIAKAGMLGAHGRGRDGDGDGIYNEGRRRIGPASGLRRHLTDAKRRAKDAKGAAGTGRALAAAAGLEARLTRAGKYLDGRSKRAPSDIVAHLKGLTIANAHEHLPLSARAAALDPHSVSGGLAPRVKAIHAAFAANLHKLTPAQAHDAITGSGALTHTDHDDPVAHMTVAQLKRTVTAWGGNPKAASTLRSLQHTVRVMAHGRGADASAPSYAHEEVKLTTKRATRTLRQSKSMAPRAQRRGRK